MMDPAAAVQACEREVVALHEFFVAWFAGRLHDAAFDEFLQRFSDDFEMVTPDGTKVDKARLGGMRGAKGSNGAWQIHIHVRLSAVPRSGGRYVTGTYLELQQGAGHGSSAGADRSTNGRISTPLLELDAGVRPHGVRWLRLAETWLPEEQLAAFDFGAAAAAAARGGDAAEQASEASERA
ncbi:unnamed protein product [Prorocentrum cordatum]|uniref:SnoaL-like domain-containing protein n=1 Tax=Prorocentrum cordatum TaxID=2364126 RepID=A0ABN9W497_9DINO|nr:unnamed protein product [Polarella glacialis]